MRQTHWPKLEMIDHRHGKVVDEPTVPKASSGLAPGSSAKGKQILRDWRALGSLQQEYEATLSLDLQGKQLRWSQRSHRALNDGNVFIIAESKQAFDPKHMWPRD